MYPLEVDITHGGAPSFAPIMTSPSDRLQSYFETEGAVTKTELARTLGYKSGYQIIHKWTKGRGFTEQNQLRAEDALGLPRGYFSGSPQSDSGPATRGPTDPHPTFVEFLEHPRAKKADPRHLADLREIACHRFRTRPTVDMWKSMLIALEDGEELEDEGIDITPEKSEAGLAYERNSRKGGGG